MPHDGLLKRNAENKELARTLKMKADSSLCQHAAPKATSLSLKKRAVVSNLSPTRSGEEKIAAAPAPPRGQKRARECEGEEAGDDSFRGRASSVCGDPWDLSRESSPGLPGFSKVVKRNNRRRDRSPLNFSWAEPEVRSPEPPTKRRRKAPAKSPSLPLAPLPSPPRVVLPPPSSSAKAEPRAEGSSLRRGRSRTTTRQCGSHEIFGTATLGSRYRSKNDPWGIHGSKSDYSCGQLDNMLHHRLEYPEPKPNPWAMPHPAIKRDPRAGVAKRLFFEGQSPDAVLMVAGVPLEERDEMFPPELEPETTKPPVRKGRGRKAPASKKRKGAPKKKGGVDV